MYGLESVFTLDQLVLLGLEKLARNLAAPSHVYLFGPSVGTILYKAGCRCRFSLCLHLAYFLLGS